MKCDYGCNSEAPYTLKNGKHCCHENYQQCPTLRAKNSQGIKKMHYEGKGYNFSVDDRNKSFEKQISEAIKNAFCQNSYCSNEYIKKRMISHFGIKNVCGKCNIHEWMGVELRLDLHHINGDEHDNRIENLILLCPNCHSITPNYKGRNINNGKQTVSDSELLEALRSEPNIRKALIKVKLSPRGANYKRVYKLQLKFEHQEEKSPE